jgi:hypothetical protein
MTMLGEVLTGAPTCSPECVTCRRLRDAAASAVLLADGGQVTLEHLAAAAGVGAAHALGHCPEGAARVVADAYRRAATELFGEYAASLRTADPWPEKLTASLQRLLYRLAAEPAVAHLCFVAPVASGDEQLRAIRETFRGRYVALLEVEQDRHAEADPLPNLQLELMVGAVFRTISGFVGDGRAPELPTLLEDVAGAAQVFEPRVPVTA